MAVINPEFWHLICTRYDPTCNFRSHLTPVLIIFLFPFVLFHQILHPRNSHPHLLHRILPAVL
jgi:hypothetical protein